MRRFVGSSNTADVFLHALLGTFLNVLVGGTDHITASVAAEEVRFGAVVLPKSGPGDCHKDHEREQQHQLHRAE